MLLVGCIAVLRTVQNQPGSRGGPLPEEEEGAVGQILEELFVRPRAGPERAQRPGWRVRSVGLG